MHKNNMNLLAIQLGPFNIEIASNKENISKISAQWFYRNAIAKNFCEPAGLELFTSYPANAQRRYNVAATSRSCSDVVTTLLLSCVFAG